MNNKVTIDHIRFFRVHLTPPRGVGYWVFESEPTKDRFSFYGQYSKAKKLATDWAIKEGHQLVMVLP